MPNGPSYRALPRLYNPAPPRHPLAVIRRPRRDRAIQAAYCDPNAEIRRASSFLTRATTSAQSRLCRCRNRRAVGYHGQSSRPSSQRQSGAKASRIQVGRPSAPARWAILVSTVITRSRQLTSAAVSAKSVRSEVRSRIAVCPSRILSSGLGSFCRLMKVASASSRPDSMRRGIDRL